MWSPSRWIVAGFPWRCPAPPPVAFDVLGCLCASRSEEARWRAVDASHPVALVRAGLRFERPEAHAA